MMATRVSTEQRFDASRPVRLFAGDYFFLDAVGQIGEGRTFDVSADGQRFLMLKTDTVPQVRPQIFVMQNLAEELKRLAPTK